MQILAFPNATAMLVGLATLGSTAQPSVSVRGGAAVALTRDIQLPKER